MRISESCVDPNPLIIERQDPDNFTRFQTRERCALEIAAYVFNSDNRQVLKPIYQLLPLLMGQLLQQKYTDMAYQSQYDNKLAVKQLH